MNSIRQIQELNRRELENNVSPNASWHADYRDTAYIYIGGLPFELSEGDVITIFSQYGEPTYINLVRDKETGKSRGFAFLKYEDQRSCDLAVDNLGGAVIMGRTLKVDHTRYKKKEDEEETGIDLEAEWKKLAAGNGDGDEDGEGRRKRRRTSESEEEERPMLKEEMELAKLIQDHDEDDPMKAFLVAEKKEEVAIALARLKDGKSGRMSKGHRHRHHHRSRREKEERDGDSHRSPRVKVERDADGDGKHSYHQEDRNDGERRRSRSRDDKGRRGKPSGHDRSEDRKENRRSPRRDSRERVTDHRTRDYERSKREESGHHRSRRDS